jgi:hypothetical protein
LLFFQLENLSDIKHQDYILQAKQILDNVGNQYREYISNFIIENNELIKENLFISLESEENNIYLHDAPKNSMYTGGIVFPKINQSLNPTTFDVALDSLLNKTIVKNNQIIHSLENGSDKLGFLRSQLTQSVSDIIKKDSMSRSSLLVPKINKHERYLETSSLNLNQNKGLESGYLFSKSELDVIIESYKSVIPLIDKTVSKKQRKQLLKKYKQYYKQLNKLLFYKELKKKNTVGELLEIKTGIPVSNSLLSNIKIKDIHRRSKLPDKEYIEVMQSLRLKVKKLETIIENPATELFIDGSKKTYYYISEKSLL